SGAAGQAARSSDVRGAAIPIRVTPAAPAIEAEIEAGPAVDRNWRGGRRFLVKRRDGKIGSAGALCGEQRAKGQHASGGKLVHSRFRPLLRCRKRHYAEHRYPGLTNPGSPPPAADSIGQKG